MSRTSTYLPLIILISLDMTRLLSIDYLFCIIIRTLDGMGLRTVGEISAETAHFYVGASNDILHPELRILLREIV